MPVQIAVQPSGLGILGPCGDRKKIIIFVHILLKNLAVIVNGFVLAICGMFIGTLQEHLPKSPQ